MSIDVAASFGIFSEHTGLLNSSLWKQRTLESFPYKFNEIKIIKKGILLMPRKYFKGWMKMMAVLTETGYLHCFRLKSPLSISMKKPKTNVEMMNTFHIEKNTPYISTFLGEPRTSVQLLTQKSLCFEIVMQKKKRNGLSLRQTQFTFKIQDQNELVEWVAELTKKIKYVCH